MNDKADVSLSRGEVVMVNPESKTGFPIRHHEWDKLKDKIRSLRIKSSFWRGFGWKDLGMIFWGITLTSIASYWLPGYSNTHQLTIAGIITVVSFILGGCFVFFQYQLTGKNEVNTNITVSHIIELMEMIEIDYSNQDRKEQDYSE
ncbi:hypothetical protein SCN05_02445 [Legionella pneumophila serogroup 1]|nr:hypothetical protein [Legionella pneumophila]